VVRPAKGVLVDTGEQPDRQEFAPDGFYRPLFLGCAQDGRFYKPSRQMSAGRLFLFHDDADDAVGVSVPIVFSSACNLLGVV